MNSLISSTIKDTDDIIKVIRKIKSKKLHAELTGAILMKREGRLGGSTISVTLT